MTFPNRNLTLAVAIALAGLTFASAGLAQDTTQPAPDSATASDLAMGADPNAVATGMKTKDTAAVGETYVAATFEQWEQRCAKTALGKDPCQFYQLLKDANGQAVAEISMFALPADQQAAAGATIIVPLETLLTKNLLLSIDGGQPKAYPFSFCTAQGCVARVGFTAEEVDMFKKGTTATLTIVPAVAPEKTVDLDISLKGFTAGYEAVKASNLATGQ